MSKRNKEVIESSDVGTMPEVMRSGAKPELLTPITHDDLGATEDRRDLHTNGDTPPAPKEPKDAKFYRLAIKRVPSAIKRIRHVANLANRSQYEYTQEHAEKIISALENELTALKNAFTGTKASAEAWTL